MSAWLQGKLLFPPAEWREAADLGDVLTQQKRRKPPQWTRSGAKFRERGGAKSDPAGALQLTQLFHVFAVDHDLGLDKIAEGSNPF